MLADACKQAKIELAGLAAQLRALTADPVRVQVSATSDQAEADAVKRGQRPELIAALRKAL